MTESEMLALLKPTTVCGLRSGQIQLINYLHNTVFL
jgi:hypothetical protein